MIYDCFQFFNELDLLKLRLNVLNPVVDYFVITEATDTFSGEPKSLYYAENKELFKDFNHKIIHNVVDDTPKTKDISAFDRDGFQKGARMRGLKNCHSNDIILFSDLDEIPNPDKIKESLKNFDTQKVYHFAQRQFYFYLNLEEVSGRLLSYIGDYENITPKKWLGTYIWSYSLLDKLSISEIRVLKAPENSVRVDDGGWHFTYMGGDKNANVAERVAHKVKSAAHQEFNNREILDNIEKNINKQRDIFGRDAKFKRIEIDNTFPEYLLNNLSEYSHLILPKKKTFLSTWFNK